MAWLETAQTEMRARLVRHLGALHLGFAGADRLPHMVALVVSALFFFPARNDRRDMPGIGQLAQRSPTCPVDIPSVYM